MFYVALVSRHACLGSNHFEPCPYLITSEKGLDIKNGHRKLWRIGGIHSLNVSMYYPITILSDVIRGYELDHSDSEYVLYIRPNMIVSPAVVSAL